MSSRSLGHAARARMIIPAPAAQPCGKARKGLVRNLQSIDFYIPMTHCQNSQQEGTRLSHAPLDKHVDKFGLVQYGRGKPLICRAAPQIACFLCTRRGRKRHDSRLSMRRCCAPARALAEISAAGAHAPKRRKSATFSARAVSFQPVLRKPAAMPLMDRWMPVCTRSSPGSARQRRSSSACRWFSGSM